MTHVAAPWLAPDSVAQSRAVIVSMGRMGVARETERLSSVGLGSCVAVIVFAPKQRLAALAHCMLPDRSDNDDIPAKFADSAVPALLGLLHDAGGTAPYAAAIVGGASMFPALPSEFVRDIAGSNVDAARKALADASIPLRVEDVGGHIGRSVFVDPSTQRIMVRTLRDGERWL